MKRNFVFLVLLAILFALAAIPVAAQTATVKGVCKDAQGAPVTDAQVVWHNNDNGRTFNLKTNKKGEYFSLGIEPGKYTVTLTKEGKELDKVTNYQVTSDEMTLDFDLKKSQEQAVANTAKQSGMTPEQVKQMQEAQANAAKYNANIKVANDKLLAATNASKAGDNDTAIATLNETSQLVPNEDYVWYRLGSAYLESAKKQTDAAEKTKRNTEAYTDLQKAIQLKKDAMAKATQAPATKTPGQPAGLTDNQKLAAYYDNLAQAAARTGKTNEAADAYRQAAELDPPHAGGYYFNLGATLTNGNTTGDEAMRKQALDAFDKAIAADPNNADAYYWKAEALVGMAKMENNKMVAPEGTAEAFKKYLDLKPDGPHAEEAKQMLAMIGSTVQTTYGTKKSSKKP